MKKNLQCQFFAKCNFTKIENVHPLTSVINLFTITTCNAESLLNQGTLTEGEGSEQLTSSFGYIALQKDQMMFALSRTKEVNCTEISPSIRVPWFNHGALW
jgi:hypothetical protein